MIWLTDPQTEETRCVSTRRLYDANWCHRLYTRHSPPYDKHFLFFRVGVGTALVRRWYGPGGYNALAQRLLCEFMCCIYLIYKHLACAPSTLPLCEPPRVWFCVKYLNYNKIRKYCRFRPCDRCENGRSRPPAGPLCGPFRGGDLENRKIFSRVILASTIRCDFSFEKMKKIFCRYWKWLYLCTRFRPENRVVWNRWEDRDSVCQSTYEDMWKDTKTSQEGKKAILTMKSLILAQDER